MSILGIESKKASQLKILKDSFTAEPYPRREAKDQLAESLNISRKKVEKWFSNRRYEESSVGPIKKSE